MNDDKNRPLIRDSALMRILAAGVGTALTIGFGWAAKELSQISRVSTQSLEDIQLFELQQEQMTHRVDRISGRVDSLYDIMLEQGRFERGRAQLPKPDDTQE